MNASHLYHYKAYVKRVYDGDTCTVDIDLGMSTWLRGEKIRLHRIDAPEIKGEQREAGVAARDFLRNLILDREVLLKSIRDRKGKYGRYLGEIQVVTENGDTVNVNETLVSSGHAVFRDY